MILRREWASCSLTAFIVPELLFNYTSRDIIGKNNVKLFYELTKSLMRSGRNNFLMNFGAINRSPRIHRELLIPEEPKST